MQSHRQETRLSTLHLPRATNGTFYAVAPETGDLSDREVEVLRLVAEGLSNKEIAWHALSISTHTVARHVTNIMRKLDAANRAQAATMAFRRGLLAL